LKFWQECAGREAFSHGYALQVSPALGVRGKSSLRRQWEKKARIGVYLLISAIAPLTEIGSGRPPQSSMQHANCIQRSFTSPMQAGCRYRCSGHGIEVDGSTL